MGGDGSDSPEYSGKHTRRTLFTGLFKKSVREPMVVPAKEHKQASTNTGTRREFLKAAGLTGVAVAGVATEAKLRPLSKAAEFVAGLTTPQKAEGAPELSADPLRDFFLINYAPENRKTAEAKIQAYRDEYSKYGDFQDVASQINLYQPLIDQAYVTVSKATGKQIDPIWKKLMLGIIFIESKGDPTAIGKYGEKGLCQLKDEIIEAMQKTLGWGKVDPMNAGNNITLGLAYLNYCQEKIGEPGMSVLTYHEGEPRLRERLSSQLEIPDGLKTIRTMVDERNLNPTNITDPDREYFLQVMGATEAVSNAPR